jgi:hypothetical protein
MAITSALTNTFKAELLGGEHDFAAGGNTFKLALFVNATLGSTTTTYAAPADANAVPTNTNEVSDKTTNGGATATAYTAGGRTLTLSGVGTTTTTSFTSFADLSTANTNSWTSATFTTDGCMIYNSSVSNKAICAVDFGGAKTVSNGTFSIEFPTNNATSAIIRLTS